MKKVLTIAGSDSSGGAGIQADLKTFMAFGVHGMSAITALTAQNSVGVQGIFDVSPEFVREQIRSVMTDIGVDAAKTGMLSNAGIVKAVADSIREFRIPHLVVDPVMIAKSGASLLEPEARKALCEELLPLAEVATPNIFEAETILGRRIEDTDAMKKAARELKAIGCRWVVIKGGRMETESEAIDVMCDGDKLLLFRSPRRDSTFTHGSGCTFASAIAAGLAKGMKPPDAVRRAKDYVTDAIRKGFPAGRGHAPANHMAGVSSKW